MAGCKPLAGDFARAGAGGSGEAGKRGSGEAGKRGSGAEAHDLVIPAQAGIQRPTHWTPAFAGVTRGLG